MSDAGVIENFVRELVYSAHRLLTWSPPSLKSRIGAVEPMIAKVGADAPARHAELAKKYDLSKWPSVCTPSEYRESLWVLDLLDRWVVSVAPPGQCLDVGSKNGAYLPGCCAALPGPWTGVELDAHRRYVNLATRRGHALGLLAAYPASRYVAGSVTEIQGTFSAITWFLPFIIPEPFDAWELPKKFYEPERLLNHVWSLLAPGGVLLLVNQEEEEAEVQAKMFAAAGISVEPLGVIESPVSPYRVRRFGFRAVKPTL